MHARPCHWDQYLAGFHAEHPGITERVLARCRSGEIDPYAWCMAAIGPTDAQVIDVACGSGPLADSTPRWLGVDRSAEELAVAASAGRGPLVRTTAERLPVPDGTADAVVCSMSLQVLEPLDAVVAEIARLLRPDGRVVALLPSTRPLHVADALVYLRLQLALRARIRYPNDRLLRPRALARLATRFGLTLRSDERRRFTLPLRSPADITDLVASLYLPGVHRARRERAERVLQTRIGSHLEVPLRRLCFERRAR